MSYEVTIKNTENNNNQQQPIYHNVKFFNKLKSLNDSFDVGNLDVEEEKTTTNQELQQIFNQLSDQYPEIFPKNGCEIEEVNSNGKKRLFIINTPYKRSLFCKIVSKDTANKELLYLRKLNELNNTQNSDKNMNKRLYKILFCSKVNIKKPEDGKKQEDWKEKPVFVVVSDNLKTKGYKTLTEFANNKVDNKKGKLQQVVIKEAEIENYLFENQLLHGDLNTGNIMVKEKNGEMKVKLIDFGCATTVPQNDVSSPKYVNILFKRLNENYLSYLQKSTKLAETEESLTDIRERKLSAEYKQFRDNIYAKLAQLKNISSTTNDLQNSTPSLPNHQIQGA